MTDHVAGPAAERRVLPLANHPAMRDVRRWVRWLLADAVVVDMLDDALLVVIELVTNAEVHTRGPRCLALSHDHGTVLIEVTDSDPALPVLVPPSATRPGGRGIFLVDAVAADWGVRRQEHGKAVWVRLGPGVPEPSGPGC